MSERNRDLTITISGTFGAGKSSMTYILKQFLKDNGFNVEQIYNEDHPTEANFNKMIGRNIHSKVDAIRANSKIILEERQLTRREMYPPDNIETD